MKIVQICPYDVDRPGGVQHHIRSLNQELRRRGHQTMIVAPGPSPSKPGRDVVYIGRHRRVSLSGTRFEVSWARVAELNTLNEQIRDWGADIVHCHAIWVPFLPLQLLWRLQLPTIATFHDTPPDTVPGRILRFAFRKLSNFLLSRIDGAIAVSSAPMAHLCSGDWGAQPIVLPPAIDLVPFSTIKRAPGGTRVEFSVLFIGRLEPRKGIKVLLDAWRMVEGITTRGGRTWKLTVAGAGELEKLVLAAQKKHPTHRLLYVRAPSDEEVRQLLATTDLVVAPSPYGESFGLVLIEALAAGIPVLAADNSGYRTVMTGPGRKALIKPADAPALAAAIANFACSPELLQEQSEWGRQHAWQFDIRKVAPSIEELYSIARARHRERRRGRN